MVCRIGLFFLFSGVLLFSIQAQQLQPEKKVEKLALRMFPEEKGSLTLQYKLDYTMLDQGFRIVVYSLRNGEKEVGLINRIQSIAQEGPGSDVDVLVRYTREGTLVSTVNLMPWKVDGKDVDITPMLTGLTGIKVEAMQDRLNVLLNALVVGPTIQKADAAPAVPKDYVLNLEQKILTTGAQLPPLTMGTLAGTEIKGGKDMAGPFVLAFVSLRDGRTIDFVKAMEVGRTGLPQNPVVGTVAKTMQVVYVVGGSKDDVNAFAAKAKLDPKTVVADSADQLQKLLQIPFKPYMLMFDKVGILQANSPWEDEDKLLGMMYLLCGGKMEGE